MCTSPAWLAAVSALAQHRQLPAVLAGLALIAIAALLRARIGGLLRQPVSVLVYLAGVLVAMLARAPQCPAPETYYVTSQALPAYHAIQAGDVVTRTALTTSTDLIGDLKDRLLLVPLQQGDAISRSSVITVSKDLTSVIGLTVSVPTALGGNLKAGDRIEAYPESVQNKDVAPTGPPLQGQVLNISHSGDSYQVVLAVNRNDAERFAAMPSTTYRLILALPKP